MSLIPPVWELRLTKIYVWKAKKKLDSGTLCISFTLSQRHKIAYKIIVPDHSQKHHYH